MKPRKKMATGAVKLLQWMSKLKLLEVRVRVCLAQFKPEISKKIFSVSPDPL